MYTVSYLQPRKINHAYIKSLWPSEFCHRPGPRVVTFRGTCFLNRYGTRETRGSTFLTTLTTTYQFTQRHTQNNLNFHFYETHTNLMLSACHTSVRVRARACACVCARARACVCGITDTCMASIQHEICVS
jgi:hypothetical protein